MKELWNWIQFGVATVGGVLGGIIGGLDGFLYALIAFVVTDYVTGVMMIFRFRNGAEIAA